MLSEATLGYLLGLCLITTAGAHNAFVLGQGLRGRHVWAVTVTPALSDALMILVGVVGVSYALTLVPSLVPQMQMGGTALLLALAARALWSVFRPDDVLLPADGLASGLSGTWAASLARTWRNPHLYVDSALLIGLLSAAQGEGRQMFAMGAIAASFSFFLMLGFGARPLAPVLAKRGTWRILNGLITIIIIAIAGITLLA